jgi:predicted  nucleic acid-binding Zn-ribbon protein
MRDTELKPRVKDTDAIEFEALKQLQTECEVEVRALRRELSELKIEKEGVRRELTDLKIAKEALQTSHNKLTQQLVSLAAR